MRPVPPGLGLNLFEVEAQDPAGLVRLARDRVNSSFQAGNGGGRRALGDACCRPCAE